MISDKEKSAPVFIKPDNLHLYGCAKFVDIREPNVYAEGHLKNALNMHEGVKYVLPTSNKDSIDQMKIHFQKLFGELGINRNDHLVIYEQCLEDVA